MGFSRSRFGSDRRLICTCKLLSFPPVFILMKKLEDILCNLPCPCGLRPDSPDGLRLWAPAKINLNLLVGPVRADGFHPLDSIVQKISLYDEITLKSRSDGRIVLHCSAGDCGEVEKNLAYRAAKELAEGRSVGGVDITLEKRIPVGKGLGGGSSDAAAVLAGLNHLWRLELDPPTLHMLAARLGSDVPLFLGGRSCRMTGRGEILQPLEVTPAAFVLILPEFSCSTAAVYRAFDESPQAMAEQLPETLWASPVSRWRDRLQNQLLEPACRVQPDLSEMMETLRTVLSLPVHLTGSGSAMFIACENAEEARSVVKELPLPVRALAKFVESNPW